MRLLLLRSGRAGVRSARAAAAARSACSASRGGGGSGALIIGCRSGAFWWYVSGHAGRVGFPPHVLGVGKLIVFFVLHSAILEPDFDLPL